MNILCVCVCVCDKWLPFILLQCKVYTIIITFITILKYFGKEVVDNQKTLSQDI
jgi:hypothetical protein